MRGTLLKYILIPLLLLSLWSSSVFSQKIIYHKVKKGETLEVIARKYGVSPKDLMEWNNLKKSKIQAGQKLLIKKDFPSSQVKEEVGSQPRKKQGIRETEETPSPSGYFHRVKRGETLQSIAKKYGVTPQELMDWNNLKKPKIQVGQKLLIKKDIPPVKKEPPRRTKEIIYRVKAGETLAQIAQLFGVTEEDIISANSLKSKTLREGQRLLIRIPDEEKEKTPVVTKREPATLQELYNRLGTQEETLQKKAFDKRAYLKLISEYRRIYLLYPASEFAPQALFKCGELYLVIYKNTLNKRDALEAGKRFELFLKNYPQHPLAEKAYIQLHTLYKDELKDKTRLSALQKDWEDRFPQFKIARKEREKTPPSEPSKRDSSKLLKSSSPPEKGPQPSLLADLKKVLHIEPVTGEDYTRVIIDLNGNFEYQANLLPRTEEAPPRLYVDIFPAVLDDKLERAIDLQNKHLQRVRVGQFDRQTVRIVLDLRSLTDYKFFKLKEPYQLIIDLLGKERSKAESKPQKLAKVKKPMERPQAKEEKKPPADNETKYINLARQLGLGVKRIMLDAGHGGDDPGALGPNGLKEKDITLKLAKMVGSKLVERLGVEVIYTRSSDIFIPLAKRPALANSQKADLFVSIHLNASPDPHAKGIETYYLNFTTDPEAMRVAALENRANDKGLADLQDLVKAVIANTKLNESRTLAEKVQRELVRHLSLYYPDVEDRGVKYAPFLVLVGTRMPAVLVEADFITNPISAKRLIQEEHLDRLAEGIAKGIEVYIQSLKLSGLESLGSKKF